MFQFSVEQAIMPVIELYAMKDANKALERLRKAFCLRCASLNFVLCCTTMSPAPLGHYIVMTLYCFPPP